ncbi:MAG: hypothetical protein AAF039_04665 [Bacteroidota bacterium]
MDFDYIKGLLEKYYEGISTSKEEHVLKAYFAKPNIDKRLEAYRIDFQFSTAEKNIRTSAEFKQRLEVEFTENDREVFQIPKKWMKYAAAIALLVLAFAGGFLSGNRVENTSVVNSKLLRLEDEISQLKSMYALALLDQNLAHKRMEAVSMAKNFKHMEDRILAEVVKVLRYDENENVRLVALETLKSFINDKKVYHAVINSIPFQNSGIVVQDMLATPELIGSEEAKSKWKEFQEIRGLEDYNLKNAIDSLAIKI